MELKAQNFLYASRKLRQVMDDWDRSSISAKPTDEPILKSKEDESTLQKKELFNEIKELLENF